MRMHWLPESTRYHRKHQGTHKTSHGCTHAMMRFMTKETPTMMMMRRSRSTKRSMVMLMIMRITMTMAVVMMMMVSVRLTMLM